MSALSLNDLYLEELQDLYDAENRLIKALPKLAEAAESDELRNGFELHLKQTNEHARRLEQIFQRMGEEPKRKKCAAMVGLIQEGEDLMDEHYEEGVKDAALISGAQRVEHYEIAAYGCVSTWAGLLGDKESKAILEQTLSEEKETDRKLTELSETINKEAKDAAGAEKAHKARAGHR
jgi:ferritin-like metal-binding protein YciE